MVATTSAVGALKRSVKNAKRRTFRQRRKSSTVLQRSALKRPSTRTGARRAAAARRRATSVRSGKSRSGTSNS